jgi:hypothetical protein
MEEINPNNKIVFELKNSLDPYGYIIPTYMRNVNTILQAKDQLGKISWEKEGNEVK